MVLTAGGRQCPQRHAMKTVGESDDVVATGNFPGQFQGRFDGIRPRWPGKLNPVVHVPRLQYKSMKTLQESAFRVGKQIQTRGDAVCGNVLDQGGAHIEVVMAVIQSAASGEKVEVFASVYIAHYTATGRTKYRFKTTAIAANRRLI